MMNELKPWLLGGVVGAILAGLTAFGLVETETIPPADSPSVSANCPDGWADTSTTDEHATVFSCQKDDWIVILHADGSFSHGLQKNTTGAAFVYDPREVEGWPVQ
jgi:hypothetical protein